MLSEDEETDLHDADVKMREQKDIFGTYSYDSNTTEGESDEDARVKKDENPWKRVITEAWDNIRPVYRKAYQSCLNKGDDKDTARDKAFSEVKTDLLNHVAYTFLDRLNWTKVMRKDRTYRKLKKSASVMPDREDFDDEEAMRYALRKRKFLLERIKPCLFCCNQ